jgi:hypothetical protein
MDGKEGKNSYHQYLHFLRILKDLGFLLHRAKKVERSQTFFNTLNAESMEKAEKIRISAFWAIYPILRFR